MNLALLRFVADYLSDHAARTVAGDGTRGRVHIDNMWTLINLSMKH